MGVLLIICGVVLALPVLLVIAIALGPAALGILFLFGCTALVLSVGGLVSRQMNHKRVPPPHM